MWSRTGRSRPPSTNGNQMGKVVITQGCNTLARKISLPPCGIRSWVVVCIQQFHLVPVVFAAAVNSLCVLWFPNCIGFGGWVRTDALVPPLLRYQTDMPLAWLPIVPPPGAFPFEMEVSWTLQLHHGWPHPGKTQTSLHHLNNLLFNSTFSCLFPFFPCETGVIFFFVRSLWCASPSASFIWAFPGAACNLWGPAKPCC